MSTAYLKMLSADRQIGAYDFILATYHPSRSDPTWENDEER
jgi:hypothetical protein